MEWGGGQPVQPGRTLCANADCALFVFLFYRFPFCHLLILWSRHTFSFHCPYTIGYRYQYSGAVQPVKLWASCQPHPADPYSDIQILSRSTVPFLEDISIFRRCLTCLTVGQLSASPCWLSFRHTFSLHCPFTRGYINIQELSNLSNGGPAVSPTRLTLSPPVRTTSISPLSQPVSPQIQVGIGILRLVSSLADSVADPNDFCSDPNPDPT